MTASRARPESRPTGTNRPLHPRLFLIKTASLSGGRPEPRRVTHRSPSGITASRCYGNSKPYAAQVAQFYSVQRTAQKKPRQGHCPDRGFSVRKGCLNSLTETYQRDIICSAVFVMMNIVPIIKIATNMRVKKNTLLFHFASAVVFMCRKKIR